jgi:adenylate cyclase
MADLIAQGEEAQQRWRRPLPSGESLVLGRAPEVWNVPWDPHVSRRHARLEWDGWRLHVVRLAESHNPIFFRGKQSERFSLVPGEHFVIGATTFTLADQQVCVTADAPLPVQQQSFSAQSLKQIRFRNPDYRIEVLSRVPEVLSGTKDQGELCVALVAMLLAGVPGAEMVAVVVLEEDATGQQPAVRVLHWDQRLAMGGDFQPSQRLIQQAIGQQQSVLYVWGESEGDSLSPFTARGNVDWACCTPVPGKALSGWGLYLAGRFAGERPSAPGGSEAADPREDVKFTELVAAAVGAMGRLRALERQQASLSQFFSPVVLKTLWHEDPEVVLAPREALVSVLFCDLRGFSLETERHAGNLLELLNRVSRALGVMTHQILDQGGVVGDFQGDAAMGFWGWPLAQEDAVSRTCGAALAIRAEFEAAARDPQSPLAGFQVGIGIATGNAVAGKIGTVDQVKVTVFGPAVNLASRLEGMTRLLGAPILLDQSTAQAIGRQVSRQVARVRRLGRVRPYGMDMALEVSELLPPESQYPLLTDEHLQCGEAAVDAFLAGRWSEAYELLHRTPAADQATDFLTAYIVQHNRRPPAGWDGVIALGTK